MFLVVVVKRNGDRLCIKKCLKLSRISVKTVVKVNPIKSSELPFNYKTAG